MKLEMRCNHVGREHTFLTYTIVPRADLISKSAQTCCIGNEIQLLPSSILTLASSNGRTVVVRRNHRCFRWRGVNSAMKIQFAQQNCSVLESKCLERVLRFQIPIVLNFELCWFVLGIVHAFYHRTQYSRPRRRDNHRSWVAYSHRQACSSLAMLVNRSV